MTLILQQIKYSNELLQISIKESKHLKTNSLDKILKLKISVTLRAPLTIIYKNRLRIKYLNEYQHQYLGLNLKCQFLSDQSNKSKKTPTKDSSINPNKVKTRNLSKIHTVLATTLRKLNLPIAKLSLKKILFRRLKYQLSRKIDLSIKNINQIWQILIP